MLINLIIAAIGGFLSDKAEAVLDEQFRKKFKLSDRDLTLLTFGVVLVVVAIIVSFFGVRPRVTPLVIGALLGVFGTRLLAYGKTKTAKSSDTVDTVVKAADDVADTAETTAKAAANTADSVTKTAAKATKTAASKPATTAKTATKKTTTAAKTAAKTTARKTTTAAKKPAARKTTTRKKTP